MAQRQSAQTPKPARTPDAAKAPERDRRQISATVNARLLRELDTIARETGRNRSDMLDDLIEFYAMHHPDGRLVRPWLWHLPPGRRA